MEQSHRNTEPGLKIRRLKEFVRVGKVYRLSTIIKHHCLLGHDVGVTIRDAR